MFQFLSTWDEAYDSDTVLIRLKEGQYVLHASQVCRYWRSVALQLPKLWRAIINVDVDSAEWIKELLRRSGNLPLKIESNARVDKSSVFTKSGYRAQKWGLVFKEMHRIRVFHLLLHRSDGHSLDPLVEALVQPAPLMESLQVISDAREFGGNHRALGWTNHLFAATAPKLHEIAVQGMGIPRHFLIPNMKLNSLSVSTIPGEPSLSPSEWLDVLAEQPQLSDICIKDMDGFTPQHLGQGAQHRQVFLPHLHFLFLTGPQGFINEIYPRIVAPRDKCAYILELLSLLPLWHQANHGILEGLARLFEEMEKDSENDSPCRAWKICWLADSCLTIDAYDTELTDDDPMFTISMHLASNQAEATIIAIFDLLRNRGLLKEADTLKLRLHERLDGDAKLAFISLLQSCHKLSKLVVMGASTVDAVLLDVFYEHNTRNNSDSNTGDSPSTVLLPNLDLLVYNEDVDEFLLVGDVLFAFLNWRIVIGKKIPRFWMCLTEPEFAMAMFTRHPHPIKAFNVDLKVTETEEWDVVPRTPFPSLF